MRYNEKSDIWALGCLLYEMCALAPPFEAQNHLSLAVKINSGKFNRIPTRYSDDLHRAIRWMLQREQEKRPAVEELERLPPLKKWAREASLLVREHQVSHSYAQRYKELKQREEEVRKREQAVAEKERQLATRERDLSRREVELNGQDTGNARYPEGLRRYNSDTDKVAYPAFSEGAQPPPAPETTVVMSNQEQTFSQATSDFNSAGKENQYSHFQMPKNVDNVGWPQQQGANMTSVPITGL